jgi:DNA processing protein
LDDPRLLVALALRPGLTPAAWRELRREGMARVAADPGAHVRHLGAETARLLTTGELQRRAAEEMRRASAAGYTLVTLGADGYPTSLARIVDPPPAVWVRGRLGATEPGPAVAVVGSRASSAAGRELARVLARDLARAGVTIVSGLARGIDTAAHQGALDGGGRTVAVLGCGIDRVYPPENVELARRIANAGAIVSEYPPGTPPRPAHFPRRNRVIAGLAAAVVVVEAGKRSGALVTARLALDEGREVMAVPGHPSSELAWGVNQLLKDGAALVRDAQDVAAELGLELRAAPAPRGDDPVLALLERGPASADELGEASGMDTPTLLAHLTELEVQERVRRLPGALYVRI